MLALLAVAPQAGAAASGESGLLRALETAPLLVVGRVEEVTSLSHMGFAAGFSVERVLRGDDEAARAGRQIEIAWEELSPNIEPRLRKGTRLIVALGKAPRASIWQQRIPDAARRGALRALDANGLGFLAPGPASVLGLIEHYLALTTRARRGEAGATYLSRFAALAPPRLALDAVERLRSAPDQAQALTPPAAEALLAALMRTDAEAVSARTLRLVEEVRPAALGPVLDAQIQKSGGEARARLLAAQAALQGGLSESLEDAMLASDSEAERLTATRWAAGPKARERLRTMTLHDGSQAVREAALVRLVELEGAAALDVALRGLDDSGPRVRLAAINALASFGPETLNDLRVTIDRGSPEARKAAVVAVSMMEGEEAREELERLAEQHSDPAVRAVARITLGRPLDEEH